MFFDRHENRLQGLRSTLGTLVTPIVYLADVPKEFIDWASELIVSRSKLIEENKALKKEHFLLRAKLQKYQGLQAENGRLRNLLGTQNKTFEKRLLAEIIQIDSDPFILDFIINKGSLSGVYVGQTVVDARGVVGQVVSVFATSARVLMISDTSHSIPVRVVRNNVRSIASGSGQINQLFLRNVTDTTDIKVGDQLVSSGLGQRFPVGYPVATVTQVIHDPGRAYAIIYARPTARLEQLASVLLIWTDSKTEVIKND